MHFNGQAVLWTRYDSLRNDCLLVWSCCLGAIVLTQAVGQSADAFAKDDKALLRVRVGGMHQCIATTSVASASRC